MTRTIDRVDHVIPKEEAVFSFGPEMKSVLEVDPGSVVTFETHDCFSRTLPTPCPGDLNSMAFVAEYERLRESGMGVEQALIFTGGRTGTSTVTITASDGQASSSVPVTVRAGGNGRDTLTGTSGADLLLGQNGDDTLSGAGDNDVLCGANGNDKLSGGTDSDTFDGGPGTDAATDYNAAAGDSKTNIP